jgi:translocation and assembly module TamB
MMPASWLKPLVGLTGSALMIVISAFSWLLLTTPGLHAAITTLNHIVPGLIDYTTLEGRLIDQWQVTGLKIHVGTTTITIEEGRVRWQLWPLTTGKLVVNELYAQTLTVHIPPSDQPQSAWHMPARLLPFALAIQDGVVEQAQLKFGTAAPIEIARLDLGGAVDATTLALDHLNTKLTAPIAQVSAQGSLSVDINDPLTLQFNWQWQPSATITLSGQGTCHGTWQHLQLQHQFKGPVQLQTQAVVTDLLTDLHWHAQIAVDHWQPSAWSPQVPIDQLRARITGQGTKQALSLRGRAATQLRIMTEQAAPRLQLIAHWRNHLLTIEHLNWHDVENDTDIKIQAQLKTDQAPQPLRLQAQWHQVRWPLVGEAQITLPKGQLALSGTREQLAYQLATQMQSLHSPDIQLQLAGSLTPQATQIKRLQLQTLDGVMTGTGSVAWQPMIRWHADVAWRDINPGRYWAAWPGQLQGQLSSTGTWMRGTQPQLTLHFDDVHGTLRTWPLQARGQIAMTEQGIALNEVAIQSATSHVHITGHINEASSIDAVIESPNIGHFLPEAQGSMKAHCELSGAFPTTLKIAAAINARALAWRTYRVKQLDGQLTFDAQGDDLIDLDVTGQNLSAGQLNIDQLAIQGQGTKQHHNVTVQARYAQGQISTAWYAGLSAQRHYGGQITQMTLRHQPIGTITLRQPTAFELTPALTIDSFCLDHEVTHACMAFTASQNPQQRVVKMDWERVPLAWLTPLLPANQALDGQLNLKAQFQQAPADGFMTGTLQVTTPQGRYQRTTPTPLTVIDFSQAQLEAQLNRQALTVTATVPMAPFGRTKATLNLPAWQPGHDFKTQEINGQWQLMIDNWSSIQQIMPTVQLSGQLQGAVQLGGTITRPLLDGQLQFKNGTLQLPMLTHQLTGIDIVTRIEGGQRLSLQGQLYSTDQPLKLQGQAAYQPETGVWQAQLHAQGDQLPIIMNQAGLNMRVSPDVTITADAHQARIEGVVQVPQGTITLQNLSSSALAPSPDVRRIDELTPDRAASSAYPIVFDVQLAIAHVDVDAFGLTGLLSGALRVLHPSGKGFVGDGQLTLSEGTYRFPAPVKTSFTIGPPLKVTQGYIVFSQTPLTNPGLVLTAYRQGGDITAGVQVVGTARQPQLTFFSDSDPNMTQSEISRYLLTGLPPRRRGEARENPTLSLGTYITPKLFVEYESILGEQSDQIKLRYSINDWLELQTETGTTQGADLFMTFER